MLALIAAILGTILFLISALLLLQQPSALKKDYSDYNSYFAGLLFQCDQGNFHIISLNLIIFHFLFN